MKHKNLENKVFRKAFAFEFKASSDDGIGRINGYGSVFGNKDSYGEIVVKGAFNQSLDELKGSDLPMLWQHQSDMPVGLWKTLKQDDLGLKSDGIMPLEIISIKEKHQMAQAGLVKGLSIGYRVRKDGYEFLDDGTVLLKDLDLREISLVTFPANPLAIINDVKSITFNESELTHYLKNLGLQSAFIKQAVNDTFSGDIFSEKDNDDEESQMILKSIQDLTCKLRGIQ